MEYKKRQNYNKAKKKTALDELDGLKVIFQLYIHCVLIITPLTIILVADPQLKIVFRVHLSVIAYNWLLYINIGTLYIYL